MNQDIGNKKAWIEVYIPCPHCEQMMCIERRNCDIFRHGVYKNNNKQIPPHLPKKDCDELARKDLIYGCGKPFELSIVDDELVASICEYK